MSAKKSFIGAPLSLFPIQPKPPVHPGALSEEATGLSKTDHGRLVYLLIDYEKFLTTAIEDAKEDRDSKQEIEDTNRLRCSIKMRKKLAKFT